MSSKISHSAAGAPPVNALARLLPLTLAVFVGFLCIGMPMPVLPLHLSQTLGLGTLGVGLVMGSQFAAALLSRAWAGALADTRGARQAVVQGMALAAASGLAYLVSRAFENGQTAVWVLAAGRILLGCAESLIVTGALSWGVGMVGPQNAGKVMAWVGIAMYGAYAAGAPAGVAVQAAWGFSGIAVATVVLPIVALAMVVGLRATPIAAQRRTPFYKVLGTVWLPGLGLALSSVGFGVITTFAALLFAARGWGAASLAFTAFGVAFIGARLFFGHLPDKLGGVRVALAAIPMEAAGLLLIWGAGDAAWACLGAALTGFGYSLAFPAFGVEAVRRAPPQARGAAMGAYVAFLDLAMGVTAPAAGLLAGATGVGHVYLAAALAVALAATVALLLRWPPPRGTSHA
ncbi:putative transporter [Delftia tsuruhatensis]|uniref:arabinose transporter n=1 Tax=Delftia tsuruhatensis TaxID=180282 RepID=UPI001E72F4FF|nr:arabinose transporter [Delftia tsuruhatensis]CAB5719878.1 putative transporter [Delftia tsuruhatensis]CAC9690008.1 putative transporter [Delftia tsuruhatensis]